MHQEAHEAAYMVTPCAGFGLQPECREDKEFVGLTGV